MDKNNAGPATCSVCHEDAYIRLAGSDDYICARCFADRSQLGDRQAEGPRAAT